MRFCIRNISAARKSHLRIERGVRQENLLRVTVLLYFITMSNKPRWYTAVERPFLRAKVGSRGERCSRRRRQWWHRQQQRNENEGSGVQEEGGLMQKGTGYLRACEGGKKWWLSCSHGSLQKCFAVQAAAAATIAFEYRLSLASIVCLPSSSTSSTVPLVTPPHRKLPSSLLSFLLPHYTYSPRNMCTYIACCVGHTTCSRLLNCRLKPSFCTLPRNSRLTMALGARNPGSFHWNDKRMKGTWILRRDHIDQSRNEKSDDEI